MAVTVTNQSNPLAAKLVQDTAATATAVENATGAGGVLYMVEIDNSSYGTAVYFKIVNAATATVGTTAATMVLLCPASVKRSYVFPEGVTFSTGFSHWCTTGVAESNTGAPATPPTVLYVTS
mgnify:CR=1 FL=1|tara:strand:+ start:2239 stop:2604 length:366 start_codon:yes stop_codon:yes gene_type:complete